MHRLALVASLLVAPACALDAGSEPDTNLSDPDFECSPIMNVDEVVFHLEATPSPTRTRDHAVTIAVSVPGSACPEADPASSLTIAGAPLGGAAHRPGDCASFSGTIPVGLSAPPLLRFLNAYGERLVFLGDLFAAREATPVGHAFFALPAGEELVLAWSHAADLADASATVTFGTLDVPAVVMPDGVHLTLPAEAVGSQPLRVTLATRGAYGSTFSFAVRQRVEYVATIAP